MSQSLEEVCLRKKHFFIGCGIFHSMKKRHRDITFSSFSHNRIIFFHKNFEVKPISIKIISGLIYLGEWHKDPLMSMDNKILIINNHGQRIKHWGKWNAKGTCLLK